MNYYKRLLVISPHFPPMTNVGTKRAMNLVQGIHDRENWKVAVMASKDFSREADDCCPWNDSIPEGVSIHYDFISCWRPLISFLAGKKKKWEVSTLEPKPLPHPQVKRKNYAPFGQYTWDVPGALRKGMQIIQKFKPDLIWVNADPWAGLLVGHWLSEWSNIPWIADLRDPWAAFEEKMLERPPIIRLIIKYSERLFFVSASCVVLNTKNSMDAYKKRYPQTINQKFTFIRNAYNLDLYHEESIKTEDKLIFGYFGSFRTRVSSQIVENILKGFAAFIQRQNLVPEQVSLAVQGRVDDKFCHLVYKFELQEYISLLKKIHHSEALGALRSWDVLLVLNRHNNSLTISAKLYDYLAARKPILAVSDNAELKSIIEETKSGMSVTATDYNKIAEMFAEYYLKGKSGLLSNEPLIKPYGFEAQSKRFLEVLEGVLKGKR